MILDVFKNKTDKEIHDFIEAGITEMLLNEEKEENTNFFLTNLIQHNIIHKYNNSLIDMSNWCSIITLCEKPINLEYFDNICLTRKTDSVCEHMAKRMIEDYIVADKFSERSDIDNDLAPIA